MIDGLILSLLLFFAIDYIDGDYDCLGKLNL